MNEEIVRNNYSANNKLSPSIGRATPAHYGLGQWWSEITTPAKIWTVIGILGVIGITAAALDDDEDDASPVLP